MTYQTRSAHSAAALARNSNEPIPIAHWCGDVSNLIATRLALADCAAELLECLQEERLNVVWLQPFRLGAFHILAHPRHRRIHGVVRERALIQQILNLPAIDCVLDRMGQLARTSGRSP